MQGNPYQMYQPMYGNPYAPRMQPNPVPYYPQPQQQAQGVVASMVTSQKEAEAAQILFNNDVNVFVDSSGSVIYTKRFNPQTGAADFAVYRRAEAAQETPAAAWASQADVDAIRQQLAEVIDRLDRGRRARREDAE